MQKKISVRMHIFSGRRNPEWILNEQEVRFFLELFLHLGELTISIALPTGLGYKGFELFTKEETWFVHHGYVHFVTKGKTLIKADVDFKLENFIRNTMPKHIEDMLKR